MLSVRADGVLVDREGEPALFIPRAAIEEVRLDRGIAGEVYEAGSVLIITWSLGDYRLDTGVRSTSTADHSAIALAAKSLLDSNSGTAAIAPTEGAS